MVFTTGSQRADPCLLISIPIHSLQNRRILIVDDIEAIHDDFRKILRVDGREPDYIAEEEAIFGTSQPASPAPGFVLDFASQGRDALALVTAAVPAEQPYANGTSRRILQLQPANLQMQADEILALMALALEESDVTEIQRLAHKLGGSSACCGTSSPKARKPSRRARWKTVRWNI